MADRVGPVVGPVAPELRHRELAIDRPPAPVARGIHEEGIELVDRRLAADQVEAGAAQERRIVGALIKDRTAQLLRKQRIEPRTAEVEGSLFCHGKAIR